MSSKEHHEPGEAVLLLSGALFAPFTLLTCLMLYRLAGCRREHQPPPSEERRKTFKSLCRASHLRQMALLAWLTAATALSVAGVGHLIARDVRAVAAPGDQLMMRLGAWTGGICASVSVSLAAQEGSQQQSVELFSPGLARSLWRTRPIVRGVAGRLIDREGLRRPVEAAWQLPVAATAWLRVAASYRHRLRLQLMRDGSADAGSDGDEADRSSLAGYGPVELANAVQGINSVTDYNITHTGRLTMKLTNLDDLGDPEAASYTYNVSISMLHYVAGDADSQTMKCQLGPGAPSCLMDNPPSRLVMQLPPDHASSSKAITLALRCDQRSPLAQAAPAILAAIVSLPCALLLTVSYLLGSGCRYCLSADVADVQPPHSHHFHQHGKSKKPTVRFQLPELSTERF